MTVETKTKSEPSVFQWASKYATEGYSVIPIVRGTKRALGKWSRWQTERASLDQLKAWFSQNGNEPQIAIVTGTISNGLAILDFDGDDWQQGFDDLQKGLPELRDTRQVKTGSGARHLWIRIQNLDRADHKGFTKHVVKRGKAGIELRANKHYALAPPSLHPSGDRYEFVDFRDPIEEVDSWRDIVKWMDTWGEPEANHNGRPDPWDMADAATAPDPITPEERLRKYAEDTLFDEVGIVSRAQYPTRNNTLYDAAANLAALKAGLEARGYQCSYDFNRVGLELEQAACKAGLDKDDGGVTGIRNSIRGGWAKGLSDPRQIIPDFDDKSPGTSANGTQAGNGANSQQSNQGANQQAGQNTQNTQKPQVFEIVTLSDLLNGPTTIDWLIDGVMPAGSSSGGTSGFLIGDGGLGKTWLSLDLILSVASGQKWLGQFDVKSGLVLVVDEENAALLLRARLNLLMRGRNLKPTDRLPICFVIGKGMDLAPQAARGGAKVPSDTYAKLAHTVELLKPTLVVFDSLTRVHTANENYANEMAAVFKNVKRITDKFECTAWFNHHTNKQGGFRGSTDIVNWGDTALQLSRDDTGHLAVDHLKSRWAEPVERFGVNLAVDDFNEDARITYSGPAPKRTGDSIWQWLETVLEDGDKTRQSLITLAEASGICKRRRLDQILKQVESKGKVSTHKQGKNVVYHLM